MFESRGKSFVKRTLLSSAAVRMGGVRMGAFPLVCEKCLKATNPSKALHYFER